jgi:putative ABC transport system permease protein
MPFLARIASTLRNLFRKTRRDEDLDAEMRGYLDLLAEEKLRNGMPPDQARRAARIELGGIERVKEEVREGRSGAWLNSLVQDLRYGARMLRRDPAFTGIAVLTIALGIGASTAVFSVVKSALLDPWPYQGADRIVTVRPQFPKIGAHPSGIWSVQEFKDLRERTDVFDFVIAGTGHTANLQQQGYPERIIGANMTADGFSMLGVQPIKGRVFLPSEDRPGSPRVVVMSYGLWTRRFGADPTVVGRAIRLDDQLYTVVGIMPRDFVWWGSELWFPLAPDFTELNRSSRTVAVQGRLRRGVTVQTAEAALQTSASQMQQRFGAQVPEYAGFKIHLLALRDDVLRNVRESLMILMGAVAFLLFVASANVTNLLLAKAAGRNKEMATRIALGADRSRIVRQLLTESVLLAAIGAAIGCAFAYFSVHAIVSLIPFGFIPAEAHIHISSGVLLFATALAFATGVLVGFVPALNAFHSNLHDTLKQDSARTSGGRSSRRVRHSLAVGEVALALVVVCGAIAVVRSLHNLESEDLGFRSADVVTMRIGLPEKRYSGDRVTGFFRQLLQRTRELPGIQDSALASDLPLGPILSSGITIEGKSPETLGRIPDADYASVSSNYFSLLSVPILQGRSFGDQDSANATPVAVINQTMASLYWPNENPMGKRFRLNRADLDSSWLTVIGIARDMKQNTIDAGPRQGFFVLFDQDPRDSQNMSLLVRSKNPQTAIPNSIRAKLAQMDSELPIYEVEPLDTRVTNSLGGEKLAATMLSCFAAICFLLTLVGLFGVISYSASRRLNEFAIRIALGADRAAIMKLVFGEAARLALAGVALGCCAALFMGRLLSTLLYGVKAADWFTLASAAASLAAVAIAASLIPALRAMHVDPNVALRHE